MFGALLPLVKPQYATYANEKAARVYISLGSPSSTGMVSYGAQQKVTLSISIVRFGNSVFGLTVHHLIGVRSLQGPLFYVHQG